MDPNRAASLDGHGQLPKHFTVAVKDPSTSLNVPTGQLPPAGFTADSATVINIACHTVLREGLCMRRSSGDLPPSSRRKCTVFAFLQLHTVMAEAGAAPTCAVAHTPGRRPPETRHVIDEYGDHVHACKKHNGSCKAAHETILDAIEAEAGITTERRNIPSVQKRNKKMGPGDLVLKNCNLGGHRHLVIDVAVNHGGDLADVSRNGAFRDAQPGRILESTVRTKVDRYRAGYAAMKYAFRRHLHHRAAPPFLRLLYIIAQRRTTKWSWQHSSDEASEDAF